MPVMMTHKDHGTTFAVGAEVEWNKQHGWKSVDIPVDKRETSQKTVVESESLVTIPKKQTVVQVLETPAMRYEKKFGKKPHHRMAEKTILKALEE